MTRPSMMDWLALMLRVETLRELYGLGMASAWRPIHEMNYPEALAEVGRVEQNVRDGVWSDPAPCKRQNCDSPLHVFFREKGPLTR